MQFLRHKSLREAEIPRGGGGDDDDDDGGNNPNSNESNFHCFYQSNVKPPTSGNRLPL